MLLSIRLSASFFLLVFLYCFFLLSLQYKSLSVLNMWIISLSLLRNQKITFLLSIEKKTPTKPTLLFPFSLQNMLLIVSAFISRYHIKRVSQRYLYVLLILKVKKKTSPLKVAHRHRFLFCFIRNISIMRQEITKLQSLAVVNVKY
jgi:hypothetical protein